MAKSKLSVNQRNTLNSQRRELLQRRKSKGLSEGQQARLDRIEVQLGLKKEEVRRQVDSVIVKKTTKPAPAALPPSTESNNLSDQQRMDHAVAEAVELGLIREEVLPANTPTDRKGYILSSSHYANHEYDPAKVDPQTRTSQIQLFQLAHIMNQHGVEGPIYCEGRKHNNSYSAFRGQKPIITVGGKDYDIHTPIAQKFLFEHPEALQEVMDQHLVRAGMSGASTPSFYAYTNYNNIQGAHTGRVEQSMNNMVSDAKWSTDFEESFKFFTSTLGRGTVNMNIGTGWDSQGNPALQLAGQWVLTEQIIPAIEHYLRYADRLASFDEMREEDVSTFMLHTNEDQVPSCFCGLGHTLQLSKKLQDNMNVHILTPSDSMHLDKLRRTLPINHPQAGLMNIDIFTKVLNAARAVGPQPGTS